MKPIKVVIKMPNEAPLIKEIKGDYNDLSNICQGLIDFVSLPTDDRIDIVCNDEFLYNGMEPNIVMPENESVLCGPIIFVGYDPEDGSTIGLDDDDVKTALEYIKRNEVHHMCIESAYRYSRVMKDYQKSLDAVRSITHAKLCD